MKYMLLIYWDQSKPRDLTPEEGRAEAQSWYAFLAEAQEAGVLAGNGGLAPVTTAKTIRVRDSQSLTTDGPFAETHEHLGGFHIVDVKDMDEALAWAAKSPGAANGSIEVRAMYEG